MTLHLLTYTLYGLRVSEHTITGGGCRWWRLTSGLYVALLSTPYSSACITLTTRNRMKMMTLTNYRTSTSRTASKLKSTARWCGRPHWTVLAISRKQTYVTQSVCLFRLMTVLSQKLIRLKSPQVKAALYRPRFSCEVAACISHGYF